MTFTLNERLEADTLPIMSLDHCDLLMMNDNRWPWIMLVPRIPNAVELHDLGSDQQSGIWAEVMCAAKTLKQVSNCEKINIGALGNLVSQLHVSIVARNSNDLNWPGPVWGFESRIPYEDKKAGQFIAAIRGKMEQTGL